MTLLSSNEVVRSSIQSWSVFGAHPCPITNVKRDGQLPSLKVTYQTPTGLAFSGSILYCLIARATSFPVIFPSLASAAIAACAM